MRVCRRVNRDHRGWLSSGAIWSLDERSITAHDRSKPSSFRQSDAWAHDHQLEFRSQPALLSRKWHRRKHEWPYLSSMSYIGIGTSNGLK